MRHSYPILLDIDLHLFDGAAGGAAAGDGGTAAQGNESALPKADTRSRGSSRRGKTGAYDNVVFGIQEAATSAAGSSVSPDAGESDQGKVITVVESTSDSLEAKRKAFRDLIEGEYREQYTEEFQAAFNRRFKDMKGMENSLSAQKPIMDMLLQRYNITDGDMAKLQTALEQDDAYWEEAADKAGLTVEQYKAMQKLERENAELKAIRQRQQGQQMAQQQMNQWYADAEKVKEIYPSFDFRTEAQNKQFTDLLRARVPMQQAYEIIHMEEIKANTARAAAQSAGQQMVAKIQSKASRPLENGTSAQSAAIVKNDVHSLTKKDRAEVARRAQRGDKIVY